MDRAALLQAVALARSAAAAGQDDRQTQRQLDGKQFELRIRFGCGGPAQGAGRGNFGWIYDDAKAVLRIWAAPTISTDDPAIGGAPEGVEAVEGFWIPRPWLFQPVCPAAPVTAGPPSASGSPQEGSDDPRPSDDDQAAGPRIGIAQFFTAEDARSRRRDKRPYESVTSIDPAPNSSAGYDIVIFGRLQALTDGRVIRCVATAQDRPPDCIVSVRTDRVRFERPGSGETIAQWSSS